MKTNKELAKELQTKLNVIMTARSAVQNQKLTGLIYWSPFHKNWVMSLNGVVISEGLGDISQWIYEARHGKKKKPTRGYGRGKKSFTMRLTPQIKDAIENEASKRGCSKTEVVEMAVFEFVKNQ